MNTVVLCLRPEVDFTRVDAPAPATLRVTYRKPDDADVPALMRAADALIIPAVGPKLAPALFEGSSLKLVQVTGAGVDRLDRDALTRLNIPVANVAGGSNGAVAEYVVTTASTLLRRFAWAGSEIKAGNYVAFRARMVADNGTAQIHAIDPVRNRNALSFRPQGCPAGRDIVDQKLD